MTTNSAKQFVKAVQSIQTLPEKTGKAAVQINAAVAVRNADAALKQATNGSARLRNAGGNVRAGTRVVGKRGAALTVSSTLENDGQQAFIKAVGPWQLIEYDTKLHDIGPAGRGKDVLHGPTISGRALRSKSGRSGAKAREGRALALRTPYGLKRRVTTRGTRGKYPWKKAFEKTAAYAPTALATASTNEVAKVIK